MFDDLIPAGNSTAPAGGMFDDLLPGGTKPSDGGFMASAKQSAGSLIKGAGQFAGDFIPGVEQDNLVKRYGLEMIDANPTSVHSLSDIADKPVTAAKEAVGNAASSMAGIVGARLIGQGITAAAPLTGPAAPIVAGVGQGISLLGPYAVAALPSFGGIREQQIQDNPEMTDSTTGKAAAALGAAAVGVIENKFGPQEWALSAMTKGGRDKLAEQFASKTVTGSVAKGMATGAAVEGGEELVQNPIEQLAGFQDPTSAKNVEDTVFGGAMGAIGGGIVGGPMAGMSHRQPAVVPRSDGSGEIVIDPATGPLSAAAAEHVNEQAAIAAPVDPVATGDLFADLTPAEIDAESEQASRDNLSAWAERANDLTLENAQSIAVEGQAAGHDLVVVEHPNGQGHTVVPRSWISSAQQQSSEALQPSTSGVLTSEQISTPADTKAPDLLAPRIQAVLESYEAAGHPEHTKIIRAALQNRAPTDEGVAFWEQQLDKNLRTWETIAGRGKPIEAKQRSVGDLWEGKREQGTSQYVPEAVVSAVLARSNGFLKQLADRGINIDEVDSRFPADVTAIKAQESGLRGLFLRYAKQLEAQTKGYKRFNPAALAKTKAELFHEVGLTVDQAASQANTAPSEAQIAAGNYQKGHIKVGALDIAIENPAGSTRTGPGWSTKMQAHYGYLKRTEGADGDQVDVYVKSGTPADHSGPVFVVDQIDPTTGRFDEHKAMIGYRFMGAAIKAYDAHFGDGTGPSRRKSVVMMTAEQFKTWAKNGDTKAPAATPQGWDGFEAGDKVTTKAGTNGTLHFDDTKTVAYVTPDTLAGGIANPDTGKTTPQAKGSFSVSPAEVSKAAPATIQDFGEKIGGARKDTAQPTAPKAKAQSTAAEVVPGWHKRFTPIQNMLRSDPTWNLFDTKTGKPVRGAEFKSEQAAKDAIPMIAVAQKHRVVSVEGGFEIMRDVSDRKRVKVVDQIFPSREEAMSYMAKNAQAIVETKTSFREELFARPEKVMRDGAQRRTGPATAEDFGKTFGFRGVEFGNWNNQDERQEVMNHAFDGLLDLADVLGAPPKALSLNGDLALAFGARGQGLSGAVAHYERNYGVINLTKMQGAGALAHEWFHAIDHYLGRQDGKAGSEKVQNKRGDLVFPAGGPGDYASHGLSYKSAMREELRDKYRALVKTIFTKAEKFIEDTAQAEKFVGSARDALVKSLTRMRESMEKASPFGKRNNKPATADQLAEFDRLAADIIDGKAFALEARAGAKRLSSMRLSNDTLDALSDLYKAVRGRSGMNAEKSGVVDGIRGDMRRYADRVKMLDDARNGSEKTKQMPTRYAMDAKRIDQGSATDYWTTPHEMAARAFSAFVEDKLPGRSDFLSYGSDNNLPEYRMFNVRPFPEGAERVAINQAFESFIGALQTKETETGLAFFDLAAPLSAPNGKPSNLSKEQHAQVRTPAFKAWFGDWEASAINARVNQQLEQWVAGSLKSSAVLDLGHPSAVLAQFGVPDLPVHLTQAILKKAVKAKHSVDVSDLKDLAINIAAPIAVFGSKRGAGHIVLVTEARHTDGNVVVALDLEVDRDGLAINDIRSIHPKRDESVTHWIDDGLLLGLEKRKGRDWLENSVGSNFQQPQVKAALDRASLYDTETIRNPSRVVDENGEPLVAYHGSREAGAFRAFKPNERGLIWAASHRDTAASYAGTSREVSTPADAGRGILPVFLNIRNPAEVDLGGKNYFELETTDGEDFTDHFAVQAKGNGHDGAILRNLIDDGGELDASIDTVGDDFVVFDPKQLKSATQNNGDFSTLTPDFLNDLASDKSRALVQAIDRAVALEQGKDVSPVKRGSARLQLAKLRTELEQGKIDEARFVVGVEGVHAMLEEVAQAKRFAPSRERARGVDYIRQRLLEAKRNGDIGAEAADLAEWFVLQNPALVSELGISIKTAGQAEEGARGRYLPLQQIVRLFKGSAGTETAVHEVLHHFERMMPAEMQDAIRLEYERRIATAIKKGEHADYFKAILAGDYKLAGGLIQAGKVPYSLYAMFNPSEFWAVNMAELVSDRFAARNSAFARIKQWLIEAIQHVKALLGLRSDAPMIKALDQLIRFGDGELTQKEMLGKAEQYLSIDTDKLSAGEWVGHQLANQRSWALGALTRDQLADIYGKQMPEVADFDRVVQEMDQARNIVAEQADVIIERWRKLKGPEADRLADVMHQATLEQFDPDLAVAADTSEQAEILESWESMSSEAQQLYRDVRDQYAGTLAKLRNGLSKRAERTGASGQRIAAEIRLQFDKYLEAGPYFPLARFGDLILIGDKDGDRVVEAFESSALREKRARQLRMTGWTTKLTAKKAYSATTDGPAGEFVGDVLKLVDGLEMDAKEKGALMDSLNQLAISSLPDQSYRRHFTHRKGTTGYSQDAMRAFASSMQHVGHHVARVLHGDELTLLLTSMNKRIAESTGDVDTTEQQQVANELAKRLDLMLTPDTHPVTALAGQVGFVMSLGGSVASGLTNLSQTPLITFPWLGAKFGFDKAAGALTKASTDYFGGRWDKWSGFVLKDNKALSPDEKRALQQLEDAGLITLTQTSDLASTATTDSASSSRSWAINRAMKLIGWTFSVPEVFNRQVSALAAYRLAVESGQGHDEAVQTALETLRRTHFDYSASNRSRWMAGNFTRVITMFKQYSQQMTYLLWRNAHQALKGESPEVRREARRMLIGVAAMHFGAAGALGLPLGVFGITPLLGLLSMGMGDGDDPWDWQVEFRNMLADVFGKAGGEAIAHGPLRMLLNIDFASRVGLGDLWVRSPQGDQEGKDLVEAWMLTLLGPVAGYIGNLGNAAKAFDEGKVGRGLEAMLPKMLAAPLKAARYESEGVKSWRGDDLGVALDGGDILGTALGFNPTKIAEMHEGQAAIKGREQKLMGRRQEIVNQWMAAVQAGDQAMVVEAMQEAMRKHPANPG